jgi:hypothetical protein
MRAESHLSEMTRTTTHATLRAIVIGGSVAAALDIFFAISFSAYHGLSVTRVLQSVASGVLGKASYSGGAATAALGLVLHFAMAYGFASAFLVASQWIQILVRRPVLSGALFGVLVFLVMRLMVLPLSAFPHPVTFKPVATVLDLLSHMFFFGVPIALAVSRMQDPPAYWFPAKQRGWGWGPPAVWEGWAVMAVFVAALVTGAMVLLPSDGRTVFVGYAALLCAMLVAVCWIKGEPPAWRTR